MEMCSINGGICPQLLNLISTDTECLREIMGEENRGAFSSEDKQLELRLAPPGEKQEDFFSFSKTPKLCSSDGETVSFSFPPWSHRKKIPFLQFPTNNSENKAISPDITAVSNNSSQKRTAPSSAVGWPPIRSSRKNLASNSPSKLALQPHKRSIDDKKPEESGKEGGLFVKINMDGNPIGRKVDLKAFNTYQHLFNAVQKLFTDFLPAGKDSLSAEKEQDEDRITDLCDGDGGYTLVYEDEDGDRMLVGDVPWHMFVCTAKRLRVLKSSEISGLSCSNTKGNKLLLGLK